ncbi:MAG: peptidase M23 [Methylophaga sp.]|nr:MAG: peptidase M23 [Methylophaga sp.]
MQIIIISPNSHIHKHWHLTRTRAIILAILLMTLLLAGVLSAMYLFWQPAIQPLVPNYVTAPPFTELTEQNATKVNEFYTKRLGELQAEAIRLKALTEKIATMSGLDTSEYSLSEHPGQGGIEAQGFNLTATEFDHNIEQLTRDFVEQQTQLTMLEDYLITNNNIQSAIPTGRPIKGGWLSSAYGSRIDPFSGKKTFHHGIDFAGKSGSEVYAVADGIVTWIGKRGGYGGLVEVDHGNGYVTRYGHNKTVKVEVGDRIKKGQVLALMGSTGRSTGPHVHFEVLRDGKQINPYNFVKR